MFGLIGVHMVHIRCAANGNASGPSASGGGLSPGDDAGLGLGVVATASGCLGFGLGVFWKATWQVCVESAQVLAGLVEYPADNPFYYYHLKLWTLLSQVPAVLLNIGFDERVLCIAVSGFIGALSFMSLSMCTYALCRNVLVSILSPVSFLALYLGGGPDSTSYPVIMMGTQHTYGVAGRGAALLSLALVGAGAPRLGLFLMGLAPAIHLPWGCWCVGVGLLGFLWGGQLTTAHVKRYGLWFLAGLSLTGASFVCHAYMARTLPKILAEEQTPYLEALVTTFDVLRMPVSLFQPGIYLPVFCGLLAFGMLFWCRRDFDNYGASFLRTIVVAGAVSLFGALLTWFPDLVPALVTRSMPSRFTNFCVFAAAAFVLGLMGRYAHARTIKVLIWLHIAYIPFNWFVVPFLTEDKYGWKLEHWREFVLMGSVVLGWRLWAGRTWRNKSDNPFGQYGPRIGRGFSVALAATIVLMLAGTDWFTIIHKSSQYPPFRGPRSDVLITASEGNGFLVVAPGMEMIQLRTRRPLLFNISSLDQISYFPASAVLGNTILRDVYGIDLLGHRLADGFNTDAIWEARTPDEWQNVRAEFGVTEVLVASQSTLQLPEAARDSQFALYRIPARPRARETESDP